MESGLQSDHLLLYGTLYVLNQAEISAPIVSVLQSI